MICANCGKQENGPKHEADPEGKKTMPSGWFSRYVRPEYSLVGCGVACFDQICDKWHKDHLITLQITGVGY